MTSEQYLAAVEARLSDLPWRVRKNLAEDLQVHLGEIPAGEDLVTRLGSPEGYAAELRAAAGLKAPRGPAAFLRARRPRNVVLALILLAVAAALAAALAWARSYQPLSEGSTNAHPFQFQQGAVGEAVAIFRLGKPFQFGFSIRNTGRFSVRILDVPLLSTAALPVAARPFLTSERIIAKPTSPFRPFTLEPGSEHMVMFVGTYAHCKAYSPMSSVALVSVPVRARFLLWSHTVQVPLQGPLVIKMPKHPCLRR